jgi:hypothetical protein
MVNTNTTTPPLSLTTKRSEHKLKQQIEAIQVAPLLRQSTTHNTVPRRAHVQYEHDSGGVQVCLFDYE